MPKKPVAGDDTPYGPVPAEGAYDKAKSRLESASSHEHQNPSEDMLRDVAEVNAWEWMLTQNMTPADHAAELAAQRNPKQSSEHNPGRKPEQPAQPAQPVQP